VAIGGQAVVGKTTGTDNGYRLRAPEGTALAKEYGARLHVLSIAATGPDREFLEREMKHDARRSIEKHKFQMP